MCNYLYFYLIYLFKLIYYNSLFFILRISIRLKIDYETYLKIFLHLHLLAKKIHAFQNESSYTS